MKKIVNLLLLLLFLSMIVIPVQGQESVWFKGSFEQALDKAKKEQKLILIDFFSDT